MERFLDIAYNKGRVFLTPEVAKLERKLMRRLEECIEASGFEYYSIPSLLTKETYIRQDTIPWEAVFRVNDDLALSGSAEQGILEFFTGKTIEEELQIYAMNQCFRNEALLDGVKKLYEFNKMELFVFSEPKNWESWFERILKLPLKVMEEFNLKYRVVDTTRKDPGYHLKKYDIEVLTKTYGWMETHSCSYFGDEQTKRFDIGGGFHTLSNTGFASPRILIPFIENQ